MRGVLVERNYFQIYTASILTFFILGISLIPLCSIAQEEENSWKLAKDKDGIKVFTRKNENFKIKEYKSIATFDVSPEVLMNALLDVDSYHKWMAHVKIAEILATDSVDNFYVYTEVDVPWPFDNRDQVTFSEIHKYPETGYIEIIVSIIPDYVPENKGIVRMPQGKGKWAFKPLGNGKTEAYHQFGGDPGGKIPSWVANTFLVDGPYKTMMGLKRFIKEEIE